MAEAPRVLRSDTSPGAAAGTVVYLTNQSPYPPYSGGQMREWQFLRRLGRRWDVHLVAVTPHLERDTAAAAEVLSVCRSVSLVPAVPRPEPSADLPSRMTDHWSPDAAAVVAERVSEERADLVHVEGYFLMQHVDPDGGTPVLLVEENIEYLIDARRDELLGPSGPDWTRTRDLEQQAWRRATRCGTVSADDLAVIRDDVPGVLAGHLPNGCDHIGPAPDPADTSLIDPRQVLFVGSAGWGPSRDAAHLLVTEIWPLVRARVPDGELVLAGAGMDARELGLPDDDPSVRMIGTQPDLGPVFAAAGVFVCPVRYGGGVKAKILESLHAGCAVVSSRSGLQGLSPAQRRSIVPADGAAETADAITRLLLDHDLAARTRAASLSAARSLTTWDEAERLMDRAWSRTAAMSRLRCSIEA
jgi:glycosyltransferase involved in cell wall biosynthesis